MRAEGAPKERPGCSTMLIPAVAGLGLFVALTLGACNNGPPDSCLHQVAASSGTAGYVAGLDADHDGVSCEQQPMPTLTP